MYTIWALLEFACLHSNMYFPLCDKYRPDDSVLKMPFKNFLFHFLDDLHNIGQLSDFFILIYWIIIIFAVVSILNALYELKKILTTENYVPMSFGDRNYEYIPISYRRSARVVGRVLDVKLGLSIIYGMAVFRTSYIIPWLVVYAIVLPLEIFHWICDVFFRSKYDFSRVYKLMFLAIRFLLTMHLFVSINKFKEQ
jgi:hypothetical protein